LSHTDISHLSNTHTHTHTHTHTLRSSCLCVLNEGLYLVTDSLIHPHAEDTLISSHCTHTHTYTHTHTHTRTHNLSLTHTRSLFLPPPFVTHKHTHFLPHTSVQPIWPYVFWLVVGHTVYSTRLQNALCVSQAQGLC